MPACADHSPARIGQVVLAAEPLPSVLTYLLLVIAELRTTIRFDNDLQVRKDNVPEIGVISYDDRILRDDAPRVQAFDNP